MAPVKEVSRRDLQRRRQLILDRLGVSHDEYLRRAANSELSGEEWAARDDLDSIAFLLHEDRMTD